MNYDLYAIVLIFSKYFFLYDGNRLMEKSVKDHASAVISQNDFKEDTNVYFYSNLFSFTWIFFSRGGSF